ncbi:MAG: tripartite tricarboxylate transporter substrate-binding protein, partial [Burkholderiales bacterium]
MRLPWILLGLALAAAVQAQDYPSRSIRLIVASSPGSGVDIIGRLVAQRLGEALSVQVVADNRAGAGGSIGVQAVAKSPPDGYTLLMAAPSFTINALLLK